MGPFSRRDVLRGGRDLATLLSLSTLAGVESPLVAPAEAAQDARRAAPDVYRVDRRQAARQCARHVHDHQRLADAPGSARGDGCRGAALRAPRRARRRDRRAPRDADRRRVGARHFGMLGGADACNRGVHRRRQSRSARAHAEPGGLSERRSHHPAAFAQRLRCGRAGGRRAHHRGGLGRRARSGDRSADGDDLRARRQRPPIKARST